MFDSIADHSVPNKPLCVCYSLSPGKNHQKYCKPQAMIKAQKAQINPWKQALETPQARTEKGKHIFVNVHLKALQLVVCLHTSWFECAPQGSSIGSLSPYVLVPHTHHPSPISVKRKLQTASNTRSKPVSPRWLHNLRADEQTNGRNEVTLTCVTNSTMGLLITFGVGPATLLTHTHMAVCCRVMMMTKTCRAWIYPCCNSMFTEQKSHAASPQYQHQNASFLQPDSKSASRMAWSQSHVPHQQLSVRSGDELSAVKSEAGQRDWIVVRGKVLEAAFVVIHELQEALCKHSDHSLDGSFNRAWFPKIGSCNVALHPQRPQELSGTATSTLTQLLSSVKVWWCGHSIRGGCCCTGLPVKGTRQQPNTTGTWIHINKQKNFLHKIQGLSFPKWCTAQGERCHSSSI